MIGQAKGLGGAVLQDGDCQSCHVNGCDTLAAHSHMPSGSTSGKETGGVLDFKGYYAALGLSGGERLTASQAQIKAAYRRAAKVLHPDKHAQRSVEDQRVSAERFRELQAAYRVLADPRKRKAYNAGASPDL
jgi:hypothetical protein